MTALFAAVHECEIDVVDDARSQQRLAGKVIVARITQGSRPHANYHDRSGYSQERFSGSRHRRTGKSRRPKATPAQPGIAIFRRALALRQRAAGDRRR